VLEIDRRRRGTGRLRTITATGLDLFGEEYEDSKGKRGEESEASGPGQVRS
jgi:hypothetical protein